MDKCCKGLMSTVDEWDGGDTSLGNVRAAGTPRVRAKLGAS